jgi:hypothetical protein
MGTQGARASHSLMVTQWDLTRICPPLYALAQSPTLVGLWCHHCVSGIRKDV